MKCIFYLCFFIFLCAQSSDDETPIFEETDQNLEAFMNLTTNQILTIRKNKYKNLQINLRQDIGDLKKWYISAHMQLRETFWSDKIQRQRYNEAIKKLQTEKKDHPSNDEIREVFYKIYNITEDTQIDEKMQDNIIEKFIEMNIFQLKENLSFVILFDSIFLFFCYLNNIVNHKFEENYRS